MQPLDLVRASPWQKSLFTTYALSLSFFEAVVMDGFVRGRGKDPVILSDTEGVRHALAERGARLVGREYEIVPVHQKSGVFHPKLAVFINAEQAHVLIGSGNLTFGGWGGNAEFVEHFHTENAPGLFSDLADFFELLATGEIAEIGDTSRLEEFAADIRLRVKEAPATGQVRLLHNAGQSIAEGLKEEADKLGGAERLCAISPFFDGDGRGIHKLAKLLNCEALSAYSHPAGEVHGTGSQNWPHDNPQSLKATAIDQPIMEDARRLHAKGFEILCRDGRLVLSGSANATHAGLFGPNMEASLLRIESDHNAAWRLTPSSSPLQFQKEEVDPDADRMQLPNILTAELKGATIAGAVLGSWRSPSSQLICEVNGERIDLGAVEVSSEGEFESQNPDIAERAWKSGRLVLALEGHGEQAEGFLSVKAISDLSRRTGAKASQILAILAGTETPQDIAAIISWFHEDPGRIPNLARSGAGGESDPLAAKSEFVDPAAFDVPLSIGGSVSDGDHYFAGHAYAMQALLDSFRSARGPLNEESYAAKERGELSESEETELSKRERKAEQAAHSFTSLLNVALQSEHSGAHCETMLALAHYLTDRLQPPAELVSDWAAQIQRAAPADVGGEFALDMIALVISQVAALPSAKNVVRLRRFLNRHNLLHKLDEAAPDRMSAFANIISQAISLEEARNLIWATLTHSEELEILLATPADEALPALPALESHPLWAAIRQLHSDPTRQERLLSVSEPKPVCPKCSMVMATAAYEDLQRSEISKCTNWCGRLIAVRRTDDGLE